MSKLLKVLDYYGIQYDEKIICPFHGDANPSLKINLEKDFWFCFGCQEGGDAFKFYKKMQMLKGETNELKMLMSYNKLVRDELKKEENGAIIRKGVQKKDLAYYRQCLLEAKDYYGGLKKVDWTNEDNEALDYMLYRGYRKSTLNSFGAKNTYKDVYQIIFPILDNGKFKGWVCRTFDPVAAKQRKYLYNKGFRRRTTLAGNYKNSEVVMLVEGYFDMMKAKQLGIKKVAAILGWKITDRQIVKLKSQGVKKIISALDNDECGIKGTRYLKRYFDVVRFPYPKNIKDMGDMTSKEMYKIKNNFNELQEVL